MKNVIKLLAFTIAVLAVSILNGCTDFPDEYAVKVSIEEISLKDDAELSEDGKSYTATVLINFNIIQNSLNEISSAIVNINGENYDVKKSNNSKQRWSCRNTMYIQKSSTNKRLCYTNDC